MSDADDRLQALLGTEPPGGIAALDDAGRAELADLLADARRRQTASLKQSFTDALKYVPFPVRGVVKKVLVG